MRQSSYSMMQVLTLMCMLQQLDAKEIARRRAAAAKAEAKAQQEAKEAATMKKLSSFFKPIAKVTQA